MSASNPATAPAPPARPRLSRTRIDLTLARLEGLFGLIFAVLSIPVLNDSVHTLKPEWAWCVAIGVFGSMAVAAVCSLLGRGIRLSTGVFAVLFVVILLLWPFAVRDTDAAIGTQPWLWYIVTVAIAAAGISFPIVWAGVYTLTVPVVYAVLRILPAGGQAPWEIAVLDAFYALVLGAFIVIVVTALRAAASRVDDAQATATGRYAEAAKQHAAEQERTRVDTVIHDRVLSTLLAASRAASDADRALAVQMAEQALVALQSADAETAGGRLQPLGALAERCRALADTLAADIRFTAEGDLRALVPERVAEGFYSATVQAMVNSIRHAGDGDGDGDGDSESDGEAGPAVHRTLTVHGWGDAGFSVVVTDDGAGFEPDAVPADRLGLRISIRERVGSVGGIAEIRSAPGSGTSVLLEWPGGDQDGRFA
ncbi:ATP-binding protein [Herbiconiux sp.]|uniref:sensor histidine kinase n=1 Tax=Herbiconiux sp. TaxID=1871186 RepID=UPI0025C4E45F|nr:ATP-binding protein [Herbiconiux sp.]